MASIGQICSLLFTTIIIIMSSACLSVVTIAYLKSLYFSWDFLESLGNNWSLSPMTSISVTSGILCSSGTYLLQDSWPGTNEGCSCSAEMKLGACDTLMDTGCTVVNAQAKRGLFKWDGYTLCTTVESKSYLDLNIVSGRCPSSSPVSCGTIDSLGNILCVASILDCPITDIQFVSKTYITPTGYTQVPLTTKNIIYSKSSTTGSIPIQTKISDAQPCSITNQQNYYGATAFILDYYFKNATCTTSVASSTLDIDYTKLDTYSYQSLLSENSVLSPLLLAIPTYPSSFYSHDTNLYYKSYIGLKQTCKDNFINAIQKNTTDFLRKMKNAKDTVDFITSHIFRNWVSAIISCAITVIWGFLNYGFKGGCLAKTMSKTDVPFIVMIFFACLSMAGTICTISFFWAFYLVINEFGTMDQFNKLTGCLDNKSEELLIIFIDTINLYQLLSLWIGFVLSCAVLAGIIIEIIIWICCINKEFETEEGVNDPIPTSNPNQDSKKNKFSNNDNGNSISGNKEENYLINPQDNQNNKPDEEAGNGGNIGKGGKDGKIESQSITIKRMNQEKLNNNINVNADINSNYSGRTLNINNRRVVEEAVCCGCQEEIKVDLEAEYKERINQILKGRNDGDEEVLDEIDIELRANGRGNIDLNLNANAKVEIEAEDVNNIFNGGNGNLELNYKDDSDEEEQIEEL